MTTIPAERADAQADPVPAETGRRIAEPQPAAGEVRPVSIPWLDRFASALVTGLPPILVGVGMYFGWMGKLLGWRDLLILAVTSLSRCRCAHAQGLADRLD